MITSADNPFLTLPQSFDPDNYHGSQTWVDFVLNSISGTPSRSMELIGLPGMGKTFLLRYLADPNGALKKATRALHEPFRSDPSKIFPVFVEFRLLPTNTHPYIYLCNRFRDEFVLFETRCKAVRLTGRFPVDKDPKSAGDATALLETALLDLKRQGFRTAFLFDDFHLAFGLLTQEETTRLRPWREASAFILATERRLDKVNAEASGSPFYQTLQVLPFGGLSEPEARALIADPAKDADWPFSEIDLNFALKHAGGHPLLLILAGRAIWDARTTLDYTAGSKEAVSDRFSTMLIGRFKEWFEAVFMMYFEHLDPDEQQALRAVATATETNPNYDRALAFLAKIGLVTFIRKANGGYYKPFSPLLEDFIKNSSAPLASLNLRGISSIESQLLGYLEKHMDQPSPSSELAREVWGQRPTSAREKELANRRVQVAISRLRKKLQQSHNADIVSIRDQGYVLTIPNGDKTGTSPRRD